jgi:hypothetical protein
MQSTRDTVLTFLAYAIIMASTVAGVKYGVIDSNAGSLIIGGVLTHFGFVAPTIIPKDTNTPPQPPKG